MVLTLTTWNNTKAEIDVSSEDPLSPIYFNMGVCRGGGGASLETSNFLR